MSAYVAGEWNDFCIAILGAAAALSGLLFASVSINIERIMAEPRLPGRAGQTLILFATPVVLSTCVLVPHQPRGVLGTELIVTGALAGALLLLINRPSKRSHKEPQMGVATREIPAEPAVIAAPRRRGVQPDPSGRWRALLDRARHAFGRPSPSVQYMGVAGRDPPLTTTKPRARTMGRLWMFWARSLASKAATAPVDERPNLVQALTWHSIRTIGG